MERIFFWGGERGGGGGEWGGAKGGEGLGLVAALQMEIERKPANQDESAVHFCKFKAPKICLCLLPKGKRIKENALVPDGMNRIPRC